MSRHIKTEMGHGKGSTSARFVRRTEAKEDSRTQRRAQDKKECRDVVSVEQIMAEYSLAEYEREHGGYG